MNKNKPKKPKRTGYRENLYPHGKTTNQLIEPLQRKITHRILKPPNHDIEKPV
jgi:hypothetical protein